MLLEVNAPNFEERARYDGLSLKKLARWSQAYVWKAADFVLPVTKVLADIVESYGVDPKRIVVIPNGINDSKFGDAPDTRTAKERLGLQDYLVLGFTGFVRDWHGLDKVIDMIAQDPPETRRHLLVVGDGPERAKLEAQAAALHIRERVTFTGLVGRDDVARHVAAFDIALQPAAVPYASPLKLFEYLALGKAIIGPAQPNLVEILIDKHNALLFDPEHPDGMLAAIRRLSGDPELRQDIGENARKTIEEKGLTWRQHAFNIVGLFSKISRPA